MLRKSNDDFSKAVKNYHSPFLKICDENGVDVESGEYNKLPKNKKLNATVEFDGHIDVFDIAKNFIKERRKLKNDEKTWFEVKYGYKYRVFQGLDCIYEITFIKEHKSIATDEQNLVYLKRCKGRKVAISHTFGAIASKLGNMPLTRLWIMKQIRKGFIYSDANEYLKRI